MKLIDYLVCDDIRKEANGKHILIGVYNSQIIFQANSPDVKWPIQKQIYLFIRIMKEESDHTYDGFEVVIDLNTLASQQPYALARISGIFRNNEKVNAPMVFDFSLPVKFPGPGDMHFTMNFTKGMSVVHTIKPDLPVQITEQISKPVQGIK